MQKKNPKKKRNSCNKIRMKTGQAKLSAHNQSLSEIAKPNKFIGRSSNPHSSLDGQYLTDFWQSKNRNK